MARMTPNELYDLYKNGYEGCAWEQDQYDYLMENSKYGMFKDGAKAIKNSGKGKLSLPYKSLLKFDPKAFNERQVTGDCVSHATRNACDISRAVEIDINKEAEDFVARGATELVYASRNHGSQGMSCARATRFVSEDGGILVRKNYPGIIDLSKYQGMVGARWGSTGAPKELIKIASKNKMRTASLIKTIEEARDALANGYGISVCSGQGFSNKRDKNGIAKPSGSWAHAMAWIGCDDTGPDLLFLVQNSWGKWNDGPHPAWGPIPDGSFLITSDVAQRMLNGKASYAYSSFDGFVAQTLPDWGFSY